MKKEREYTAVIKKEGSWYVAWLEEVPGVNTQGRTLKEVRENLREAAALVFEVNRELSMTHGRGFRHEPFRFSPVTA
ncbi:type II toxin-antitoxin system HicB family antitoxin [Candidatus Kaiserbacteria bacterium]|nr:type II toxin-antitoxin system HicB family antitoxin [Candidatus Kaiserbacteria bacterium]